MKKLTELKIYNQPTLRDSFPNWRDWQITVWLFLIFLSMGFGFLGFVNGFWALVGIGLVVSAITFDWVVSALLARKKKVNLLKETATEVD
jgi:hypothetical protein